MSSPADGSFALVGVSITLANVILFVAIVYLRLLRPPQEPPRTVENVIKSIFMGEVME